ncbi:hypothetical protein, partial [uncultured Cloacibacillus sp.]|uniref:hypothetical protein n=1 Tax=uncultured Cloacibacillus sp. TaxID=889794 RepID=UPI00258348C8
RPYFASSSTRLNADFLRVNEEIKYGLAFDFALKGALCEGKVKRKVKQLFIFYPLKAKPLFISLSHP